MKYCPKCKYSLLALEVSGIANDPKTYLCKKCDPNLPWSDEHQLIDIRDEIRDYLND